MGVGDGAGFGGGEWRNGLFGCFDNCTVCLLTYFCPCYVFGKTAEAVGDSCCCAAISLYIPFLNLFCMTTVRGKVREQQGIEGSCIMDCLLSWICGVCVICQAAQEVNALGGGMATDPGEMERQ